MTNDISKRSRVEKGKHARAIQWIQWNAHDFVDLLTFPTVPELAAFWLNYYPAPHSLTASMTSHAFYSKVKPVVD